MPDLSTTSSSSSAHLPHVHTHTQSTHPLTYAAVFFIVIASVLGSGILGLPVKLAEAGFTPFVVTYTLGFVMQVRTSITHSLEAPLSLGSNN